jgi:hypothetical protein
VLRRHLQNIAVVLMSLHHWNIAAGHRSAETPELAFAARGLVARWA